MGSQATEDGHRVDAGGAPSRDLSGQQGHRTEKRHHRHENQRVGRLGSVKHGSDSASDGERRRSSDGDADQRQSQGLGDHGQANAGRARAQSQADSGARR